MDDVTPLASRLGAILIVGGGHMGEAVLSALLDMGIEATSITVANPGKDKRDRLSATYAIRCVPDGGEALPADTIVLAVKPQVIREVTTALVATGKVEGALVVSVAAGVKTSALEAILPASCSVVRVMPNTPLTVGFGMAAVSGGARATSDQTELVAKVFSAAGKALVVDEDCQDAVCAISGSGPAYFELFVDEMAKAGVEQGLTYEVARELALQTMLGTAQMISVTGMDLGRAIEAVSSPGGTTVAALDAMRADGIECAIHDGIAAAARRSKELSA